MQIAFGFMLIASRFNAGVLKFSNDDDFARRNLPDGFLKKKV